MENNKETAYKGFVLNGFLGLILAVALIAAAIYFFVRADSDGEFAILGVLSMALFALCTNGFVKLEPNEAMVLLFFGKYRGTFTQDGFYWVNPLLSKKKVSLRARNLNPEPIKVNDKVGNPVLIAGAGRECRQGLERPVPVPGFRELRPRAERCRPSSGSGLLRL